MPMAMPIVYEPLFVRGDEPPAAIGWAAADILVQEPPASETPLAPDGMPAFEVTPAIEVPPTFTVTSTPDVTSTFDLTSAFDEMPAATIAQIPGIAEFRELAEEPARVIDAPLEIEAAGRDQPGMVEIDLSDETLEPVFDDEPVFELSLDDGADALAGMQAVIIPLRAVAQEPSRRLSEPPFEAVPSAGPSAAPLAATAPLVEDARPAAIAPSVVIAQTAAAPSHAPLDVAPFGIFANDDLLPPAPAADLELWMPLTSGSARLWPAIEGVVSEYVDLSLEEAGAPAAPKAEHPEWTELIASLRQDMERRRDAEPTPITRVAPRRKTKPVQDEWGFFDPQQCGFAALLAKLDEITEISDEPASRRA